MDLRPLRQSADLRRLYGGRAVSQLGSAITTVAASLQVYDLTHSSLAVGGLALSAAIPTISGMLLGGGLADSRDRRMLIVWTQVTSGLIVAGLAVNSILGPQLWPIYLLVAASGASLGVGLPARSAAIPTLIRPELMPAAAALNASVNQGATLVGPAIAGLLVARLGFAPAFGADSVSFLAFALVASGMGPLPRGQAGKGAGLSSFVEGLAYVRRNGLLISLLLIDLNAMFFGMPSALFPAIGTTRFHGGATAVGLLYSAPAAGALIGAATSGWITRVYRAGPVILGAVLVWGSAIVGFGLCPIFPLAMALLALAGSADLASEVLRNSLMQLSVPDELRGRLNALWLAQVNGAPALGNFEAGAVATLTDPTISVVSGGLACIAGALVIARISPSLLRARLRSGLVTNAREPDPSAGLPPGGHPGIEGD